ncbi:MAG: cytochrome c oxidase assembly protein [Paucibacter sp.]|nr:cytochrome c oxidase assembly protein [Roseateles sp.]
MREIVIAYCGQAAVPAELWSRWNTDPLLIAVLLGLALALASGRAQNRRAGWGALALLALVFISPLCALSSALFSARVLHHVLLVAAIAPLLALAWPAKRVGNPAMAALIALHTGAMWLWHAPGPYSFALASVPAYWLMQLSLLASAWLLWRAVLAPATTGGMAFMGLGATIAQMGLLGALLVFAPRPLYGEHLASTAAWGLSPLADQQLAGLLMWVPAMLPYVAVALTLAWRNLRGPVLTTSSQAS